MLLFLSLFIEHPYSAFLLSPLSSSLSSRSGCNLYGKPQTTPQLPKRHQTKRIHSKGKWKSRLSIEYCKCKLSVCTKGQWVGCGRKEAREDREWWDLLWVIFILFLLDIGKSLKKKKKQWTGEDWRLCGWVWWICRGTKLRNYKYFVTLLL